MRIGIIKGDGIGPEIMEATLKVLDSLKLNLEFIDVEAGESSMKKNGELLPQKSIDLMKELKYTLKSPLMTPVGKGFSSINVKIRKELDLYANVRPIQSHQGSQYENLNFITVRENTEGMYIGEGQKVEETREGRVAYSVSKISEKNAKRFLEYSFHLAQEKKLKTIHVFHKANILKSTSGLFLEVAESVSKKYPNIKMIPFIIDNALMQMVKYPQQFEMIVTTNLFGDLVSDLGAGLVGGLGLASGANIGKDYAVFEAVHGTAPDIVGKGIANPSALMLSASMMLSHIGYEKESVILKDSIYQLINQGIKTGDLGGKENTDSFTKELIKLINTLI